MVWKIFFQSLIYIYILGMYLMIRTYSMDRHYCDQDGVEVVVQKFKSKIKETLVDSHKAKYGHVI